MKTVFISGHLDLTEEEFNEHYRPIILNAWCWCASFVLGDARGADAMVQRYLRSLIDSNPDNDGGLIVVYHMFDKPRHNMGFMTVAGFQTDDERDAAMTATSDLDIAWVRPGREKSGTAKNLARREVKNAALEVKKASTLVTKG